MSGMPSARGVEWKARDTKEARENWYKNYDRIFDKKEKPDGEKNSGDGN